MSFLSHLECPKCGRHHAADRLANLCTCGSPLLARYDLDLVARKFQKAALAEREPTLWRYRELLPVADDAAIVTLGEGLTPISPLRRLGEQFGLRNLFLKDEGLLPTGTFKARGAAVGVSRARELGATAIAMPTAGNAGGAWAAYAARAGMKALVVMPADAPAVTMKEVQVAGGQLYLVNGLISDAGRIVARAVQKGGWFDASTLKEPYRIEGKKTMGLEVAEQFGWSLPDVILYPTGGGVGLIGMWKAFDELEAIGWIGPKRPRLVAVQPTGCMPIVRAFQEGKAESQFWQGAHTVAGGIRVPKPLGDALILRAIRETEGEAIAVEDAEILAAMQLLARTEGLFVCPEGAATVAAIRQMRDRGLVGASERILLFNTGAGLKYSELVSIEAPVIEPDQDV
ncbi:MAG: threonine synthase [Chloroflexi bacterium]|nr:threonine synthase [Chloroflexota bacterium]